MRFKVLMKDGKFIDASAIAEEVMESKVPFLFNLDTTIEAMADAAEKFHEHIGYYQAKRAAINLRTCELVEYELSQVKL